MVEKGGVRVKRGKPEKKKLSFNGRSEECLFYYRAQVDPVRQGVGRCKPGLNIRYREYARRKRVTASFPRFVFPAYDIGAYPHRYRTGIPGDFFHPLELSRQLHEHRLGR